MPTERVAVLTHEINRGKGAALKTAFAFVQKTEKYQGIITADADGQHLVQDICRVIAEWERHPTSLVLGARHLEKDAPLRSRFGNALTRKVFRLVSGLKIHDTQTGLRAFGRQYLTAFCEVAGERYEYEMNMLLYCAKMRIPVKEVPITVVYEDGNASSHFDPLRDSLIIYGAIFGPVLQFLGSSLFSFLIDYGLVLLIRAWTTTLSAQLSLTLSVVVARLISSFCNYLINRKAVFRRGNKHSIYRYYGLAALILGCNYLLIQALHLHLGLILWLAKGLTELVLYPFSYFMQKKFVFAEDKNRQE